ncbi:hypothetical protein BGZ80_006147 [Entomortierella chlamydospora]|uniref:Uncharacterized protein n=1 Tax=Entomortierella chlamydospora TaxID=101097 RepID=A0A9P6T275_9FUNG|nr:hypothetical protein BGZ79_006409 [Entomortierella chlamydospora]KAG0019220.1 hypothetical protein BGZ80_006147 [Entomortierella chlamydospora]
MVAPIQNMLAKSMLTHIAISLTIGGVAAAAFWNGVVLPNRAIRDQYVAKERAARA